MFYGMSDNVINSPQKVKQTLLLVFQLKILNNYTLHSFLIILHWLPVKFCICLKIVVLTFHAYHELTLAYLCELIKRLHVVKSLRSNNVMLLNETRIKSKKPMHNNAWKCITKKYNT